MKPTLIRRFHIVRPDLHAPRSPNATPVPSLLTPWVRLLRRLRIRKSVKGDRFRVAPRQLRRARLAICRPEHCPSAVAVPGSTRARCSAKGCGCDDLHAVRADAVCPRGRWSA